MTRERKGSPMGSEPLAVDEFIRQSDHAFDWDEEFKLRLERERARQRAIAKPVGPHPTHK